MVILILIVMEVESSSLEPLQLYERDRFNRLTICGSGVLVPQKRAIPQLTCTNEMGEVGRARRVKVKVLSRNECCSVCSGVKRRAILSQNNTTTQLRAASSAGSFP